VPASVGWWRTARVAAGRSSPPCDFRTAGACRIQRGRRLRRSSSPFRLPTSAN